jgi:iron complex outermembrane receptor protein
LQLDLDVYYAHWIDQIVQQTIYLTSASGVVVASGYNNAGNSILSGVEADVLYQPLDGLRFEAAGSVNGSRVQDYACAYCATLILGPNVTAPLNLYSGNQLPQYSKYNLTLSGDYERPLAADVRGHVRLDYIYKSGMYDSVANFNKTQDVNRVNLHAGVERGRYRLEAFVTNLFNNRALASTASVVDTQSPGLSGRTVFAGLPVLRQGGVRFEARY